ncbi:MAG TPA: hypothetical protein VIT38_02235 [Allosphingosinicella sp.]
MSTTMELFYRARAADAARDASAATLDHVRERWQTSADTWNDLAARASRTDRMRVRIAGEKAAARAAEEDILAD